MPHDYPYGARAWNSGVWAQPAGVYPGFGRPQVPQQHEDYWATELKDNPLGLENMHIRADGGGRLQTQGQSDQYPRPKHGRNGSQNLVWVPALHDKERDRVRGRNSHHDQLNADADQEVVSGTRASSQPPNLRNPNTGAANRVPTSYLNSRDASPSAQRRQRDVYGAYGAGDPVNGYGAAQVHARPQSSAAHRDRDPPRRRSMDHEHGYGYDRAYGGRASVPADISDRYASAEPGAYDTSNTYVPSANANASRSQTLPTHRRHASAQPSRGAGPVQRSQTMPAEPTYTRRKAKQAYDVQYGYGHDYEDGDDGEDDDELDDDYVLPRTAAPPQPVTPPVPQPVKESSSMQRVRAWIEDARATTIGIEGDRGSPRTRRAIDGYEHVRHEDAQGEAYTRARHFSSRDGVSMGITRQASAPAVTMASMNPALAGANMSDITEEPDDMSRFYRRRAPEDIIGDSPSTSSLSDDYEFDGGPHRRHIRTPHPAHARRLPERSDTLRVSDGGGPHALPSPRSLNQPSRTPSVRASYEHVHVLSERERERTATPNGHLTCGVAHGGPASYSTPPITPTRQDYMYRHDGTRSPYATPGHPHHRAEPIPIPGQNSSSNPNSAAKRGGAHERSPSFQTPARLAYLYRGTTPRTKGRSPHESRSPSPLNPGQASASSGYYGVPIQSQQNTPSRAAHGGGHVYSHGHSVRERDVDGRRRSSSRAAAAAAAASATRHVRAGFWNRRGDHLTETGYVVYCPPGRNFPSELADYPDAAFRDHLGQIVDNTPDRFLELPESIPQSTGRTAERSYDSFIKYVMMPS
ncbi:hypothetical protein EW145_g3295 [Phellinidium pouzarii]|uniref:Uncharacterized protein n=1 Tax=Phellinidium pouzarii TaxID=167371 RepID=A0A4V3XCX7_9AGAM|nr:hypothetical protein EW145_g3295 [Phellinidium pouzarii]